MPPHDIHHLVEVLPSAAVRSIFAAALAPGKAEAQGRGWGPDGMGPHLASAEASCHRAIVGSCGADAVCHPAKAPLREVGVVVVPKIGWCG
jgi:hypothetical protein